MISEKREKYIFFSFLFFIVVVECIFHIYYFSFVRFKRIEYRNPFYRRAWKEYVNSFPEKKKGVIRILFISNSQGFGKEYDGDEVIPSKMEFFLNRAIKNKKRIEVLNLSIGGGQAPEYLFLIGYARKLKADLLLFSLSPANFGKRVIDKRLRDFPSDAPLSLYPSIENFYFDSHFREKYIDTEFILSSFFYLHFKSYPLSSMILDKIGIKLPKIRKFLKPSFQNKWFFSKKRRDLMDRKREEKIVLRKLMKKREDIDGDMVKSFIHSVLKTRIPAIFFNQPVREKGYEKYRDYFLKFNKIMSEYNSERFIFFDFSRKIEDKFFLDNVHLNLKGHELVAKKYSLIVLKYFFY